MKAGLVGLGYWGMKLLPILVGLESDLHFTVVWACDHNYRNLQCAQEKFPQLLYGNDFEDLMISSKVDVVFIATQPASQYLLAKQSIEKGCHVYIEKPFTGNLDLANEISERAKSKSLVVMVGYRLLFSPSIRYFYEHYGAVLNDPNLAIEASWKNWGRHQKIGVHWDLASHYIAVLTYFYGCKGEVVTASSLSRSEIGIVENVNLILKHGNNISKVDVSWNSLQKVKKLTLTSSEKKFCVEHDATFPLKIYKLPPKSISNKDDSDGSVFDLIEQHDAKFLREINGIENMLYSFFDLLRTGNMSINTQQIAISVIETLEDVDKVIQ